MSTSVPLISEQWRMPARWIAGSFLFALFLLFLISLPTRYDQLTQICHEDLCPVLWLTPEDASALSDMGLSRAFYAAFQTGIEVIAVGLCAGLSVFIFYYHSHTWMGLLTSVVVLAAPIFVLNAVWTFIQANQQFALIVEIIQDTTIITLFAFFHLFPIGRFAPRWTRWNLLLIAIWQIVTFINIGDPTEFYSRELYGIGFGILAVLMAVVLWLQVYRYRRVLDAEQKQQVKWVLFAIFINVLGAVDWFLFFELFPPEPGQARILNYMLHYPFALASQVAIPVAITIATVRYRLWDVDVLINRSLVYTALTASVLGIYVLVVGGFGAITQLENNLAISFIATGIVATSFQELRHRIQRGVNRLMYGERDEPYTILTRLSNRLQKTLTPQDLLISTTDTIATALKLPYVAIAIRQENEHQIHAAFGTEETPIQAFPLIYQNELVGELIAGQRSAVEPLTPGDLQVLANIAQQTGAVVNSVRLAIELQNSRERLVTAIEEERRRLRRDLHDGIGPALASQTLKLDAASELVSSQPEQAIQLIQNLKSHTKTLVADIRRLVYDLRPPALDELGLAECLHAHVKQMMSHQHGLRIDLDIDEPLPKLSAAVEVAIYRITQEALTNVIKHADARRCNVTLQTAQSELVLQIVDDGKGLARPLKSGVGLQSMRERTEELGGRFSIADGSEGGTVIQISFAGVAT